MNGITVGMRIKLSGWFGDERFTKAKGTVTRMSGVYAYIKWDEGYPDFPDFKHVSNIAPLFPEIPVAEVTEDLISGCGYDPEKIDFQLIAEWVRNNEDFWDLLQETISAAIEDTYPDMLVAFDPSEHDDEFDWNDQDEDDDDV